MKTLSLALVIIVLNSCANKPLTKKAGINIDENSSIQPVALFNTYWKLIEIKGEPVSSSYEGFGEAHMIITEADHKIAGNGGCNSFSGTFTTDENTIYFSNIIATKMACDNLMTEQDFFYALKQTEHYSIKGDTLLLTSWNNTSLAKFSTGSR